MAAILGVPGHVSIQVIGGDLTVVVPDGAIAFERLCKAVGDLVLHVRGGGPPADVPATPPAHGAAQSFDIAGEDGIADSYDIAIGGSPGNGSLGSGGPARAGAVEVQTVPTDFDGSGDDGHCGEHGGNEKHVRGPTGMDVGEANREATADTPHPGCVEGWVECKCTACGDDSGHCDHGGGLVKCEGTACGTGVKHDDGHCDASTPSASPPHGFKGSVKCSVKCGDGVEHDDCHRESPHDDESEDTCIGPCAGGYSLLEVPPFPDWRADDSAAGEVPVDVVRSPCFTVPCGHEVRPPEAAAPATSEHNVLPVDDHWTTLSVQWLWTATFLEWRGVVVQRTAVESFVRQGDLRLKAWTRKLLSHAWARWAKNAASSKKRELRCLFDASIFDGI